MNFRLVIFDFDGTLTDSLPWFIGLLDGLSDQFGFRRISPAEHDALRHMGPREIIQRLGVPIAKVPRIVAHLRALKGASIERIPLFDGVSQLLRDLSARGMHLAIVSSDAESNVRRGLGPENAALIHHYECGVSLFGKKSRLRRVLRSTRVAAAETIYIGDEVRDAEAAKLTGIAFGGVAWGFASAAALRAQEPWALFESVDEIGQKLLGPALAIR